MSLLKKSNKNEINEQKFPELTKVLKLNPRYFEDIANFKLSREVKSYI
ncbi:MAG: hypothetical protein KGD65_14425 [Candidatus Lokiarchaeota archaeon]|nr:hypothetical protein [Candidatus Lokiarchaeota archaeon]